MHVRTNNTSKICQLSKLPNGNLAKAGMSIFCSTPFRHSMLYARDPLNGNLDFHMVFAKKKCCKICFCALLQALFSHRSTLTHPLGVCFVYNWAKHREQGVPNKSVINTTHAIKCFRISSRERDPKWIPPQMAQRKAKLFSSGVSTMQTVSHLFLWSGAAPFQTNHSITGPNKSRLLDVTNSSPSIQSPTWQGFGAYAFYFLRPSGATLARRFWTTFKLTTYHRHLTAFKSKHE